MRFLAGLFAFVPAAVALTAGASPAAAQTGLPAAAQARIDDNTLLLDLSTGGRVTILMRPDMAPKMVERVKLLARRHFYDGLTFHRVIDGFMAQGGDPKGDGTGGSELPNVPAEFNSLPHVRGAVSAARADDPNSANSQFFIVFQPKLNLDKKYTVFGRVIGGMQYVDAIERGEPPANPSRIVHAYVAADNPPAYQNAPPPPTLTPTLPAAPQQTGPGVAAPKLAGTPAPAPTPTTTPKKAAPRRQ